MIPILPAFREQSTKAFTLIELLVVIAVIAILASAGAAVYSGVQNRAKTTRAEAEMQQFVQAVEIARGRTNKTLLQITGSGCSQCGCRNGDADAPSSLQNLPATHTCRVKWENVLQKIQDAGGAVEGLTEMKLDPWGSPYGLDENEGEFGVTDCRNDKIAAPGSDGKLGTGDDKTIDIPLGGLTCT